MNCIKCEHSTGWGDDERCSLQECAYRQKAVKAPVAYNFRAEQFGAYRHGIRRLNELMSKQKKQVVNTFRKLACNNIYIQQQGTGGWEFADLVFEAMFAAGKAQACSSVCDFEGKCPKCCGITPCDKPDGWRCIDCR